MDNTAASVKAFNRKQRCGLGAVEFGRRLLPFLTASGMMSYMLEGMEVSGSGVWMIMMAALIVSSLTVFILSFVMDRTRKRSGRSKLWIYSGILLLGTDSRGDGKGESHYKMALRFQSASQIRVRIFENIKEFYIWSG